MTAETLKYVFHHQNLTEYNDDVYRERTFDALGSEFAFDLQPGAATLFWRFGLAFSRSERFDFDPNSGRYNNRDLCFIEVNVGGMSNGQWEHPENIALSSYYLEGLKPPYDQSDKYTPGAPVTLYVRYLQEEGKAPNTLWFKYDMPNHTGKPVTIAVGDFRYFRVFAWADKREFSLECTINTFDTQSPPNSNPAASIGVNLGQPQPKSTGTSSSTTSSTTDTTTTTAPDSETPNSDPAVGSAAPPPVNSVPPSQVSADPAYWFLKINGDHWPINALQIGFEAYFNSYHHEDKKMDDYSSFQNVKESDQILGYAYNRYNAIICIFDVTEPLHSDPVLGEIIRMTVTKRFDPFISEADFDPNVNFGSNLTYLNIKLERLPPNVFQALIAISPSSNSQYFNPNTISNIISDVATPEITDDLNIKADVLALASIIAYKEVQPPLAIGLFGNWGSGKSFFMNKLQTNIRQLADTKNALFCQNVIQINFNSWHYSDSNLWASLITKIFDELEKNGKDDVPKLGKLFENLNSTQELLKETQSQQTKVVQEINSIKDRQKTLETEIEEKVKNLNALDAKDIVRVVISDPVVSKELKEIKERYDFLHIDGYQEIMETTDELKKGGFRLWESLKLIWSFRVGNRKAALAFLCLFLAAVYFLWNAWPGIGSALKVLFVPIATILVQISAFLKPALRKIKEAYGTLLSLKQTVDNKEAEEKARYNADREALKNKIDAAQASQNELRQQAEQLESKKNQLQLEINDIVSGKKIVRFIESRVTDQRYINSLGIISWIRKDFEELDFLLKQQYDAKRLEELKREKVEGVFEIDRIILYIDDLDRCDVSIVVRVLEAIHLLLAFPLFVVVVGVDPRWMHYALNRKYKELISDDEMSEEEVAPATSFDYLEKIFQIPFVLKQMDDKGRNGLIQSQFKSKPIVKEKKQQEDDQAGSSSSADVANRPRGAFDLGEMQNSGNATVEGQQSTSNKEKPPVVDQTLLKVTADEIEFMKLIGSLIGQSPRTIKRYVNIYRIIRTHSEFELRKTSEIEDYCAAMILLAILTGLPDKSGDIFEKISAATAETLFSKFFTDYTGTVDEADPDKLILDQMATLMANQGSLREIGSMRLDRFRANIRLVKRFSFRNYR